MTTTRQLDTGEELVRWLHRDGVTLRKLRQWAQRGHITRHPGGLYDPIEVADYLDHRPPADASRAHLLAKPTPRLIH